MRKKHVISLECFCIGCQRRFVVSTIQCRYLSSFVREIKPRLSGNRRVQSQTQTFVVLLDIYIIRLRHDSHPYQTRSIFEQETIKETGPSIFHSSIRSSHLGVNLSECERKVILFAYACDRPARADSRSLSVYPAPYANTFGKIATGFPLDLTV